MPPPADVDLSQLSGNHLRARRAAQSADGGSARRFAVGALDRAPKLRPDTAATP